MRAASKNGSHSTLKTEMEVARRHIPEFAWPTVALAVALYAGFALVSGLALANVLPLGLAILFNSAFIYAFYTVVHEAVHSNISSKRKDRRWADTLLGTLCCFPLWLFIDHHRKSHMAHHARTNEDDDPDIYARGSFLAWMFVLLPRTLLNYFNPVALHAECKRFGLTRAEYRRVFVTFAIYVALVIWAVAAGFGIHLLELWFVPWWIGQTVMLTLFTWTPHHDHTETGRYRNTRVSLWRGGNLLLLGQNFHLIHHMAPAVPYYRYKRTFKELRPVLEQNGVRIEGFWPNAAAPRQAPSKSGRRVNATAKSKSPV